MPVGRFVRWKCFTEGCSGHGTREEGEQVKVAERMGLSKAQVSRLLLLLRLPEKVQKMLEEGTISFSTACVLAILPQEAWAHLAKQERITRKSAEAIARKMAVTEELLDALEAPEPNGTAKKCPTCGRAM